MTMSDGTMSALTADFAGGGAVVGVTAEVCADTNAGVQSRDAIDIVGAR
jgi:hypothetical protein